MSLILALGGIVVPVPQLQAEASPGRAFDDLRQARFQGMQAVFGVVVHQGPDAVIWAVYELVHGAETPVVWVISRSDLKSNERLTNYARSDTCPQIYNRILSMERMAVPSPEIRGHRSTSPQGFVPSPPNLGALHLSYTFWSRGWTSNHEPVELGFYHLGSGPLADWVASSEDQLAICWSEDPGS